MVSPSYLGGYPVRVVGLAIDHMLFFNGREWVNVPNTTASPTVYDLADPSFTEEQIVVFDGLPVLMTSLQPGDVMVVIVYELVPASTGTGIVDRVIEAYTNVPWADVYRDIYIKPTMTYATEADRPSELMAGSPSVSFEIEVT